MLIEKIEIGGKLVAMVYAYGANGGPSYVALATFNPGTPPTITQLGEFAYTTDANACVTAVAAQLWQLARADSVRISDSHGASGACNPGHQEAAADPVCDCTGGPAHMVF